MRFAYSRPGFLTFKLGGDHWTPDFDLRSVFARAHGFSLACLTIENPIEAAREFWRLGGEIGPRRLHVWQRDLAAAGHRGYEPGLTEQAAAVRARLLEEVGSAAWNGSGFDPDPIAADGDLVLDCVLIAENQWWVGYHQAHSALSRYPGGFFDVALPSEVVSRAYVKMEEALRWSEFPLRAGQLCVELGSAPGGASQALLHRGLRVIGIDPAEMDPRVLAHPRFQHIRKRGHEVRRREFRDVDWLMADMNVAPQYTLDTVEAIVTHPQVNIRGVLLTLKLVEWSLAGQISTYLDRVRSWGYDDVRARQLPHHRQEFCLAARKRARAFSRRARRRKSEA